MRFERLTFRNDHGDVLAARLDLPVDDRPLAYALFAHCFTCTKNLKAVGNISSALNEQGVAVLRFDFTGLGESEGDFADTNFSSNVDDLVAAADFLAQNYEAPKILIGHSLGGAAMLRAAGRIDGSLAVATIGAPCKPEHVTRHLIESIDEIEAKGQATVQLAGRPFTIKKQFLDDLASTEMNAAIRHLDKGLLIFHSPVDRTVGIENAAHIFQTARHPKSFVSLDQADHLLTDPEDARYVGAVLAAWARKYVGDVKEEDTYPQPDDNRIFVRTGTARYRTDILANGHPLVADEPVSVGGTNAGPSPYDLLLAALGACTSMTLRMYADRKQWPLEAVVVRLRHQKIHARDCRNCTSKDGMIDHIEREIETVGPLDDAQKARLIEIANKCPVHRTLHNEIHVETTARV